MNMPVPEPILGDQSVRRRRSGRDGLGGKGELEDVERGLWRD